MSLVKRALISVSDKTGLAEFAQALASLGVAILSTGGTAALLRETGIPVTEVGEHTGFPEMLDGRVKTLHPRVHGGILARRDLPEHMAALARADIPPIDLVVVNLYPFSQSVARNATLEAAVEQIDIGGPAMVRAAAKNYAHVAVVTDPLDYVLVLTEMRSAGGSLSLETRFQLARKAFSHTAAYDGAISNYLTSVGPAGEQSLFPERLNLSFAKLQDLRYGENPHQNAAFYRDLDPVPGGIAGFTQLQGKDLSYNNIADADAAWECVKSFRQPACVIVKHANPCGAAVAAGCAEAYQAAFATDPTSAFGGILAFNGELDGAAASALTRQFVEVLVAPGYAPAALEILAQKPNIRVLCVPLQTRLQRFDLKRVGGGVLVQDPDGHGMNREAIKVVTRLAPSDRQWDDLLFAWQLAKFVKSNAIVFAGGGRTLGVGAGQMSRVDSARIAGIKAQAAKLDLVGSVVASDAFFPFRDGLDAVVDAGAAAVIQPGGSVRDEEVIAAADERGITMVFTGVRHFRH